MSMASREWTTPVYPVPRLIVLGKHPDAKVTAKELGTLVIQLKAAKDLMQDPATW
jgi:hypothetical protein